MKHRFDSPGPVLVHSWCFILKSCQRSFSILGKELLSGTPGCVCEVVDRFHVDFGKVQHRYLFLFIFFVLSVSVESGNTIRGKNRSAGVVDNFELYFLEP